MTLPTPITDAITDFAMRSPHWTLGDSAKVSRELERDAMHMALWLYSQDPDTFAPELREVMERWKPRVKALLETP